MIQLDTLGTLDLRRDGTEVRSVLAQPRRLALLVYLATATPRGFHSRDRLLALFWPEADTEHARNALRQALHYLRRSLGEDAVVGRGDREVGVDFELLRCDAVAFDQALEEGREEDALALYRGDFLAGFFIEDAPEAARWLEDERDRRRRAAVRAAWRLAERERARGEQRAAVLWARRAMALEPNDEASLRRLVEQLDAAAEPAAALDAYAEFAQRLQAEFGLSPAEETVRLVEEIRTRRKADAAAVPASPPPPPAPSAPAPPSSAVQTPPAAAVLTALEPVFRDGDGVEDQPAVDRQQGAGRLRPLPRSAWLRRAAVAAAAAIVLAAGGWLWRRSPQPAAAAAAAPASIAVLPFANMTGDPGKEYFSDGISEELLNVLTRVPGLQVAARTSSFAFKGKDVGIDSVGRALKVGHVLEGSIRTSGDRVRITAQLINARTGYHLWSQTYDRRLDDIFAVQDEIAHAIVAALQVEMGEPGGALARAETSDPEAHALVLRGAHEIRLATRESLERAASFYEEAIRRDPRYARAYAGLATAYMWQAYFGHIPRSAGYTRARATAERARALDPGLAEAYAVLGRIAQFDGDFAGAEAHYQHALRLNPRDPRVYSRRSELLRRQGRYDEAIASARRATELDPVSPAAFSDLATAYAEAERYPEALAASEVALQFSPDHPVLLGNRALWFSEMGRHAEAVRAIEYARARAPAETFSRGMLAYVYARAGRRAQADSAVRAAEASPGASPYGLASIHMVLGNRDRVFALLERAVKEEPELAAGLRTDESFAALHGDPRMQAILRRLPR
ncbi:MAG TPA: tetratricopeptide repeat protein [Longimicrobium sp.]|nr:tetratricopeptide repeat protein [Longimicrobium sp.]